MKCREEAGKKQKNHIIGEITIFIVLLLGEGGECIAMLSLFRGGRCMRVHCHHYWKRARMEVRVKMACQLLSLEWKWGWRQVTSCYCCWDKGEGGDEGDGNSVLLAILTIWIRETEGGREMHCHIVAVVRKQGGWRHDLIIASSHVERGWPHWG